MARKSLWPEDLFENEPVAPVAILREQAGFLSESAGGKVLGKVSTEWADSYSSEVAHLFRLEVPDLGNYTFDLFKLRHNPHQLYPVGIDFFLEQDEHGQYDEDQPDFFANSEEELDDALEKIFKDSRTISVLRTLKAQAVDPETRPPDPPPPPAGGYQGPPPAYQAPGPEPEDDDIPF